MSGISRPGEPDALSRIGARRQPLRPRGDRFGIGIKIRNLIRHSLCFRQQEKRQAIVVRFAAATCRECPARARCTTSRTGRQLFLRSREVHEAVAAAKAGQTSQHWKQRYNIRAGVEGTMRQATHVTGIRRARYHGLAKTTLEHNAAAAAINLLRLDAWWTANPLARTRTTHLQRLHPATPT